MSQVLTQTSSEELRNERIGEALDRYHGPIWKNCNRFGSHWAEDAYQQMVTKALSRKDLLEKDVNELGRKMSYMALTEAAHMARSHKRGKAAFDAIAISSAHSESFEEPLLSLDAWLDVVSKISEEKALVFSLAMQGYREGEIESVVGVAGEKVKRLVRDVNAAIGDVLMHQDVGICDEQALLLKAYAHDAGARHGEEKKLDRRVRSRLKAHMEMCEICSKYVESARGEVGALLIGALPAQILFEGRVGSGRFYGMMNSVADVFAGSMEKVKFALHGVMGRTDSIGHAATSASASGLSPGRIVVACGTAVACVAVGALQGFPDVEHILTSTKASDTGAAVKDKAEPPASIKQTQRTYRVQEQPTKSYALPKSDGKSSKGSKKKGNKKSKAESDGSKARPGNNNQSAPPAQEAPQVPEKDGGPEFDPDRMGAKNAPGGN